MKVFANLDDYYNYDYRDEKKWLCLRLRDRWFESSCYAYIEWSAPGVAALRSLATAAPVVLEIKFTPGQERDQAEVVKFHTMGWMGE